LRESAVSAPDRKGEKSMAYQSTVKKIWKSQSVKRIRRLQFVSDWYRQATASQRRLPDFIIAGTQKGGTTSLHGYLSQHPQVLSSSVKEVHYFDWNYQRGLNWYRRHFPMAAEGANGTICGESSPFYMFCPHSPRRIAELVPTVKIIVLLRNPVDRAYSHFHHNQSLQREPLPFEEAIKAEAERTEGERKRMLADENYQSLQYQQYSYLERGIYVEQLTRLWEHFPRQNTLILQSEEFFRNTPGMFDRVLSFLEIPRWHPPEFANLYPGKYKSKISPEEREKLSAYFGPHNARLFAELGQEYDWD
jgi:hypothetical protein